MAVLLTQPQQLEVAQELRNDVSISDDGDIGPIDTGDDPTVD